MFEKDYKGTIFNVFLYQTPSNNRLLRAFLFKECEKKNAHFNLENIPYTFY